MACSWSSRISCNNSTTVDTAGPGRDFSVEGSPLPRTGGPEMLTLSVLVQWEESELGRNQPFRSSEKNQGVHEVVLDER